MPAKILKFQRKLIDDQVYVCAKVKTKLKAKEFRVLKKMLNDAIDEFLTPVEPET